MKAIYSVINMNDWSVYLHSPPGVYAAKDMSIVVRQRLSAARKKLRAFVIDKYSANSWLIGRASRNKVRYFRKKKKLRSFKTRDAAAKFLGNKLNINILSAVKRIL